jgi:hypothetical protein
MRRRLFYIVGWWFLAGLSSANMCTKVVAYGSDANTPLVTQSYYSNLQTVREQSEDVLLNLGYEISSVDTSSNRITTGWRPVTSDSHYMVLFKHKDYSAASGAYYQMIIDMTDASPSVRVSVSTTVKSVAGKLSSSEVLENKFLTRLDDQLRSPQIEMTNVGVKNR